MNKLFRITAIILLILGSVVPVSAQRFHTSLPKYFEIEDANEWWFNGKGWVNVNEGMTNLVDALLENTKAIYETERDEA